MLDGLVRNFRISDSTVVEDVLPYQVRPISVAAQRTLSFLFDV
jgi:hypothetical protein